MKNKKILNKSLFEATYVAGDAEDIKDLKSSGVLSKDDTIMMGDEKTNSSSTNDSSMALKEDENTEEQKQPITVEYLSSMKDEKPFEIHGDKYEYVYGLYPNGKEGERKPAVYCYKNDMTISYPWFKEHIAKHQIDENGKINRPKDANGNDIVLKARVVLQQNPNIVGHVIQFGLDKEGNEVAFVEMMDGSKNPIPFNMFVVDDSSKTLREQDIQSSDDVVDNVNIPKLQHDVKILVDKIETVLKPYLTKIDKPVEQAELIAAIAERIGVPREKLSSIIGKLRAVASQTNVVTNTNTQTTNQVAESKINFKINYGLIVLDKRQAQHENLDILHFCGYKKEPNQQDAKHLMEELATDKEFGLTDIVEHLEILPAPKYIVEKFAKISNLNENRKVIKTIKVKDIKKK